MTSPFNLRIIHDAIKRVLPKKAFMALHEPLFVGNEWNYTKECLDTGWVSSVGKYVDRFEEQLAGFTGVKRAIAVVNGTAALHVSLKMVGVERDDEILMPALTFIATANAAHYCGAIPHFVDSESKTLGVNPAKLGHYLNDIAEVTSDCCYNRNTGRRIKALIVMHTYGHPVDLDPIVQVCNLYKLELIEDAAESIGSYYKGIHTGNWGRLSILSFNGNKTITTGGGGAILTNDEELGRQIKHVTTTAKVPHKWEFTHDEVGYNYRMPNINAALGCAQLEQLPRFLKIKRSLAQKYRLACQGLHGVTFVSEPPEARSNYWLNAILLDDDYAGERDGLLQLTNDNGIMTRPAWTLMHKLAMYSGCPRMDLSIAENLERCLINIPSSVILGENCE